MTMDEQTRAQQVKDTLESFLKIFSEYADEIFGEQRRERLDSLRAQLQKQEPQVTKIILEVIGDGVIVLPKFAYTPRVSHRDLLSTALLGGNNEMPHNFRDFKAAVTTLLNRALGAIEAGLWPPKQPIPVLVIKDAELEGRCSDLLRAPGYYDRVIREATTVLENRIRSRVPHERLARLIPSSADQTGENLVNKLFSPDNPVLVISTKKHERIAFHRIMLGIVSYLRNPYHHQLDPSTEWSWAWSTVGFVDRLLADIESCAVDQ
ncbi:MAG TPA: hypothetical protein G4O03_00460 [Dehalococcoidia bacterium]|nr:hypothetical protein [Dehalococcoidia bacterium]